ncbi:hypothetical protein ILP97_00325 [Amycolatopsis sp. H6(2020)]|nr:hypothetical protein [Amycolatopsis sp. H6(2020)]
MANEKCSFCGQRFDGDSLFRGPNVTICGKCVSIAVEALPNVNTASVRQTGRLNRLNPDDDSGQHPLKRFARKVALSFRFARPPR